MSERYSTAQDMAEDLRWFLQAAGGTLSPTAPRRRSAPRPDRPGASVPLPAASRQSDSDLRPIKIVPKGLRSFDEHDADFFLELLPGPRDREGLPDSIQFWKRRIEPIDPDLTFKVGLIYGPSGCGKSSLVKAGLLPRLAGTSSRSTSRPPPEETEARLLKGLRKACPELSRELGLVDSLATLRRGRMLPPGRKVLLVLDQFEQWLHARRSEPNTELVAALRQCDGGRIQAVVLVRDDFWLAASRFMGDLEIRPGRRREHRPRRSVRSAPCPESAGGLRAGLRNLARKDEGSHQGPGQLPGSSDFGLTQDGKIISVRLALFAEMVKGKALDPGDAARDRWHGGGRRDLPRGNLLCRPGDSRPSAPPESRPGGPQSPASRERHRPQGADEIPPGIAGSVRLCEPSQGLRWLDPHPRPGASSDHADRSGRFLQ